MATAVQICPTGRANGAPCTAQRSRFWICSAPSAGCQRHRYASFADLISYCRRSADPVAADLRVNEHDSRSLAMSDGICTALQLTNFWQDVALDSQKGRVYLPAGCAGQIPH